MTTHGDSAAPGREIIRCEVGSRAHGLATESSDRDLMGVYIETPEQVMGLAPRAEHWSQRDQPEGVRSGPGDTDLVLYSLAKYLKLATAGNPTVLVLLYAGQYETMTQYGESLRAMRDAVVSRVAGRKFLGYLDGQRERMTGGGRQSRVPNRPELVERYGFDVKYAGHALRLGLQGIELVETGALTLPMPEDDRKLCLAVKTGAHTYAEALALIDDVRARLAALLESGKSELREEPDMAAVNRTMIEIQRQFWTDEARG